LNAKLIAVAAWSAAGLLGSMVTCPVPALGDQSTLMGMLPQGFSSGNCHQQSAKPPALEKVNCDQSTDANGPTAAVFALYANADALTTGFQSAGNDVTVSSNCPGNQESPGPWTYSNNQVGGQVECGTMGGDNNAAVAVVVWTDNSKMRAAAVQGPDISALYQWWKTKSG